LADGYETFKTKVAAFYAALSGVGKRNLETPFGNTIEVSLQQSVQLTRKTSYLSTRQLGIFTLRLTVAGDLDFILLNINRYYTTNHIATVLTRDLKIQKTLQGDSYATFSFESNSKLDIRNFDEIDINSNGLNLDRFYFESEPKPKQISTNKFVYSIKALGFLMHRTQTGKYIIHQPASLREQFHTDLSLCHIQGLLFCRWQLAV